MKNTITLNANNSFAPDCVDSVYDKTNSLYLSFLTDRKLVVSFTGHRSMVVTPEANTIEVPQDWYINADLELIVEGVGITIKAPESTVGSMTVSVEGENIYQVKFYQAKAGSQVSITPTLHEGTKIADFTIDGIPGELFAPDSGGEVRYGFALPSGGNDGDVYLQIVDASGNVPPSDMTGATWVGYTDNTCEYDPVTQRFEIASTGHWRYYNYSFGMVELDFDSIDTLYIKGTCVAESLAGNEGTWALVVGVGDKTPTQVAESNPTAIEAFGTTALFASYILSWDDPDLQPGEYYLKTGEDFVFQFDVSAITGNHYLSVVTSRSTQVDISSIQFTADTPAEIVDIWLNNEGTWIKEDSASGSSVSVTQIQTTGTHIADIEVDGVTTKLYAPTGGGGGGSYTETTLYDTAWVPFAIGDTITLSDDASNYDAIVIYASYHELYDGDYYCNYGQAVINKYLVDKSITEAQISGAYRGDIAFDGMHAGAYTAGWTFCFTAPNVMRSKYKSTTGWSNQSQCGIYRVTGITY